MDKIQTLGIPFANLLGCPRWQIHTAKEKFGAGFHNEKYKHWWETDEHLTFSIHREKYKLNLNFIMREGSPFIESWYYKINQVNYQARQRYNYKHRNIPGEVPTWGRDPLRWYIQFDEGGFMKNLAGILLPDIIEPIIEPTAHENMEWSLQRRDFMLYWKQHE